MNFNSPFMELFFFIFKEIIIITPQCSFSNIKNYLFETNSKTATRSVWNCDVHVNISTAADGGRK